MLALLAMVKSPQDIINKDYRLKWYKVEVTLSQRVIQLKILKKELKEKNLIEETHITCVRTSIRPTPLALYPYVRALRTHTDSARAYVLRLHAYLLYILLTHLQDRCCQSK